MLPGRMISKFALLVYTVTRLVLSSHGALRIV